MIDVRALRDVGIAILLAVPTLSLTRPVATDALPLTAAQSTIATNAAIAEMTVDERRSQLPIVPR